MSPRLRRAHARPSTRRVITRAMSTLAVVALTATALVTGLVGPSTSASASGSRTATAVRYALAQLGDPYRYGAGGPGAFDCSGLTRAAYGSAGVYLPHSSSAQYYYGAHIGRSHWRTGDLIFWASNRNRPSTIYHVGMYVSGRRVLEAPHTGDVVRINRIWGWTSLMRYAVRPTGRYSKGFRPVGTSGPSVRAVQMRLRANGYGVAVSGYFNRGTRHAVRSFKTRYGLPSTSAVSAGTWRRMVVYGKKT
ncbi:MAG: peptidoglycan DL-endopeptidase CwlO [Actinomycetota bacterium]|jgi:hypothetical protein|nr:peptidoglycan DL-endopeptidase CwlO [Actinomycetota bacterium]